MFFILDTRLEQSEGWKVGGIAFDKGTEILLTDAQVILGYTFPNLSSHPCTIVLVLQEEYSDVDWSLKTIYH